MFLAHFQAQDYLQYRDFDIEWLWKCQIWLCLYQFVCTNRNTNVNSVLKIGDLLTVNSTFLISVFVLKKKKNKTQTPAIKSTAISRRNVPIACLNHLINQMHDIFFIIILSSTSNSHIFRLDRLNSLSVLCHLSLSLSRSLYPHPSTFLSNQGHCGWTFYLPFFNLYHLDSWTSKFTKIK